MKSFDVLRVGIVLFALGVISLSLLSIFAPTISYTGLASGAFTLCLNNPPQIELTHCQTSLTQYNYYVCRLGIVDPDVHDSHEWFIDPLTTNSSFLNITSEGVLVGQPGLHQDGVHVYDLFLQDDSGCANAQTRKRFVLNVTRVNNAPVFVPPLGPFELEEGETLRGISLSDNFFDPDGDPLTFSHSIPSSNFLISIENDELVITAASCGETSLVVSATDPGGLSADSDIFTIDAPCPQASSIPSAGGGGGGPPCVPDWQCGQWEQCLPNGTQVRYCEDVNRCKDDLFEMWRECTYVSHCYDGIQNFDEEGIDCGGENCPPCATCDDGIRNCHTMPDGSILCETGVDCGGPCDPCDHCNDGIQNFDEEGIDCGGENCPPCATCYDGIQNCHTMPDGSILCEEGVDCGGPCPACDLLQVPSPLQPDADWFIAWVAAFLIGFSGIVFALYKYKQKIRAFFVKLRFLLSKKHAKTILFTAVQRDMLLNNIDDLESRNLFKKNRKIDFEEYQEELAAILRKFYAILVGQSFNLKEVKTGLKEYKLHTFPAHILEKQYVQLLRLEKSSVFSRDELELFTEFLRLNILGFSPLRKYVRKDGLVKSVSGDTYEVVVKSLYNAIIALQFKQFSQAKKLYLQVLESYDQLSSPEQVELFGAVHLTFDEIRYHISYRE